MRILSWEHQECDKFPCTFFPWFCNQRVHMVNPEAKKKTCIVKIGIDKLHGTTRFESKILHNALGTTTQRESRSDRSSRTARRIPSSTKGPPKTLKNQPATQTRYTRTPSHQQLRHASNVSATMLSKIRSTSMISVTKPWTSCAPLRPRTRHRASRSRQRHHSSQRGRRSKDAACDTQPGKCQAFDP